MVLQMGEGKDDELKNRAIIQYLAQHALAVQHHPGALQFQVSKKMLQELKVKFAHMDKMREEAYTGFAIQNQTTSKSIPPVVHSDTSAN